MVWQDEYFALRFEHIDRYASRTGRHKPGGGNCYGCVTNSNHYLLGSPFSLKEINQYNTHTTNTRSLALLISSFIRLHRRTGFWITQKSRFLATTVRLLRGLGSVIVLSVAISTNHKFGTIFSINAGRFHSETWSDPLHICGGVIGIIPYLGPSPAATSLAGE